MIEPPFCKNWRRITMSTPCKFFSKGIQAQPKATSMGAMLEEKSHGLSAYRRSLQAPSSLLGLENGAGSGIGAALWDVFPV